MNPAILSSEKMDWRTPEKILDLVRKVGPIDLDPCTSEDNPVKAKRYFIANGHVLPWGGGGLVYCNPPYGSALMDWTTKIASEGVSRKTEIIALVPARTDTKWWHNNVTSADVICFWKGRITFVGAPSAAPFPSALAYFGPTPDRFCEVFGPYGWLV